MVGCDDRDKNLFCVFQCKYGGDCHKVLPNRSKFLDHIELKVLFTLLHQALKYSYFSVALK